MSDRVPEYIEFMRRFMPHVKIETYKGGASISAGTRETCDFCSTTFAKGTQLNRYVANSIEIDHGLPIDAPAYMSEGDWGACDTCKVFIDNNDRRGLLQRAVDLTCERYGNSQRVLARQSIRICHDAFFEARVRSN